ncbi:hypothetical protein [Planctobacterium marinum]|uniref:Aspartyl protease n=1 Tax=Planctobacterium marinum TaxID=1631968 RepID=A0AA48HY54_9ALTE|nr:hypothetical protein MACH26_35440 [Planctobacterium marinum]
MRAIFTISLLLLLLNGCALFSKQKSNDIPFRLLNNHILLPVKVNGKSMEFVLDTSAQHTHLLTSEHSQATEAEVDSVAIGNLPIPLHKTDSKHPHNNYHSYIAGIVGQDLFKHKILEINYDTQRITLHPPRLFDKGIKSANEHWSTMPLKTKGQQWIIEMPLTLGKQSQYFEFALDTGFNQDFLFSKEELGEALTPLYSYITPYLDVDGHQEFEVYPLDRTYLGAHAIIWPLINTPLNDVPDKQISNVHPIGKVGNAVLSRFNLIIDVQRDTLYYQENQRHHVKNLPDRSGLTITPHPQGAKVTSVTAKATDLLQINDVIQSYETVDINQNTFDGFRLMLSSEAERMWICWLRDNERQCGHLEMGYRM